MAPWPGLGWPGTDLQLGGDHLNQNMVHLTSAAVPWSQQHTGGSKRVEPGIHGDHLAPLADYVLSASLSPKTPPPPVHVPRGQGQGSRGCHLLAPGWPYGSDLRLMFQPRWDTKSALRLHQPLHDPPGLAACEPSLSPEPPHPHMEQNGTFRTTRWQAEAIVLLLASVRWAISNHEGFGVVGGMAGERWWGVTSGIMGEQDFWGWGARKQNCPFSIKCLGVQATGDNGQKEKPLLPF